MFLQSVILVTRTLKCCQPCVTAPPNRAHAADLDNGRYGQALAEFPDLSVCLGNGTCKPGEFARTRPLNASLLPCTFIEWPAGSPHTGGWCRSSVCPVPAAPPTLNLSWTPTYSMRLSTMSNPNGNNTGLDSEWLLDRDAQCAHALCYPPLGVVFLICHGLFVWCDRKFC